MTTGTPAETGKEEELEIYEVKKAAEQMKPILVYFNKPKDLLAFGNKAGKDAEVEACEDLDNDLWKRWVITELSKEFACVRVNVRKADPRLLRKHNVGRAPVVKILDFNLKARYFTVSPRLNYNTLSKVMDTWRKQVEEMVKKVAKSDEDSDLVKRAKARAEVIEQREFYDDGLAMLEKKQFARAEEIFNKGVAIPQESEWKKKCQEGLVEVKAGKAYVDAENLYNQRQFKQCKETIEKLIADYKEAKYFSALAKELLEKVNKKLN